jgi:D-lactate dehydrogenase
LSPWIDLCRRHPLQPQREAQILGHRHAYAAKSWFDGLTEALRLGGRWSDKILQVVADMLPGHLPARLEAYREQYAHHLILKTSDEGNAEARSYLEKIFPTQSGNFFECSAKEAQAAMLNRFVVGGAIVRYRATHEKTVEDIVALDVALPRNEEAWFETLPHDIESKIEAKAYCGHFLCHVMHQEYLVKRGEDCEAVEEEILGLLDLRKAEYPAEHNVGHRYVAKPALADFYRSLDPTNTFNPGIGKTSKLANWR